MGDRYVRMPSSMPRSDPSFSPQSSFIVETPNTGLPPTLSFWFPLVPDPGITLLGHAAALQERPLAIHCDTVRSATGHAPELPVLRAYLAAIAEGTGGPGVTRGSRGHGRPRGQAPGGTFESPITRQDIAAFAAAGRRDPNVSPGRHQEV